MAATTVETAFTVETQRATFDSLALDCGVTLKKVDVAYETYGELNADRSNAILILHAFSGDAHAAGVHLQTGLTGWWSSMIGPGLAFDTDRYFVICSNVLGGCQGTTGPGSFDPVTGERYGLRFPVITIRDMVRLQKRLVEYLGIERLLAVAGGSMGGMQALEWSVSYPDSVAAVIPIAATSRHSAQQIAFNEVGRQAIMADPDWNEGNYYDAKPPGRGLAIARMVGHITYMSDGSMRQKFGRRLRDKDAFGFDFSVDFEVESYLRYRGSQFITRFDPNSYLYITKAMDYFDLSAGHASLAAAFEGARSRFLVISFTSDWLYPTYQSLETVSALRSRSLHVAFCELKSTYGHDAFLLETVEESDVISGFLESVLREESRKARPGNETRTEKAPEGAESATHAQISTRSDFALIAEMITPESTVLDLGCGDGELLAWLRENKSVKAQGVEIDPKKIQRAIARGVSAYQSDIEAGLADYPDQTFDFVILSQTLQEMRYPLRVLREMLRVGRRAIVAFPNFGHWSTRLAHLLSGRAPRTELFPYDWFESPNLHFLTIKDFILLCQVQNWRVERQIFVNRHRKIEFAPNLLATVAVFSIQSGI
ncbi:MAG TPA: homoserine O-acetyltransferase [Chthoniobacterales bacterium]|nr:homoserine O-acetyltransferase [Chthoniobacterales bacterium]